MTVVPATLEVTVEHTSSVHLRMTVGFTGEPILHTVFCVDRRQLVPLAACANCPHLAALPIHPSATDAVVRCNRPADPRPTGTPNYTELAARTPVAAVLRKRFVCAQMDTSWATLASLLLDHDAGAIPIVGRDGRPIGIVTRRGFPSPPGEAPLHLRAGDVMTPIVHTLTEEASLSFARALVAREGVEFVPVVCSEGRIIGLFDALDATQWLAQQMDVLRLAATQQSSFGEGI